MSIVAKRQLIPGEMGKLCRNCELFTLFDTNQEKFFYEKEQKENYSDYDLMELAQIILRYTDTKLIYPIPKSEEKMLAHIMQLIANNCMEHSYEVEDDG